jgi:hypothetical protein
MILKIMHAAMALITYTEVVRDTELVQNSKYPLQFVLLLYMLNINKPRSEN